MPCASRLLWSHEFVDQLLNPSLFSGRFEQFVHIHHRTAHSLLFTATASSGTACSAFRMLSWNHLLQETCLRFDTSSAVSHFKSLKSFHDQLHQHSTWLTDIHQNISLELLMPCGAIGRGHVGSMICGDRLTKTAWFYSPSTVMGGL